MAALAILWSATVDVDHAPVDLFLFLVALRASHHAVRAV